MCNEWLHDDANGELYARTSIWIECAFYDNGVYGTVWSCAMVCIDIVYLSSVRQCELEQ